jgi:hypothetical protein
MRTEYRCLCLGCKTSFRTHVVRCPNCKDRAAIPLTLTEVRRVAFTQDVPVTA